jgi:hypothetical protein
MFDIIRKREFFECLDLGFAKRANDTLKGIQDAWTLRQLSGKTGLRIFEVGGGQSRVLPQLKGNQLWNIDKFEGVGQGPLEAAEQDGVRVVKVFMGDFSPEAPEVDLIFSISVIEHIPAARYADTFLDMARCLAPGGSMYHTVDLPLWDSPLQVAEDRIRYLREAVERAGLKWREPPALEPEQVFRTDMASNSDASTWAWTLISEDVKRSGQMFQFVSIKMIADKL